MSGGYYEGRALGPKLQLDCDVVIVGSGAGGGPMARILAEAGLLVVVLEEGPNIPSEVYGKFRPSETLRHIGREAGTTAVLGLGDTPLITVMQGRAVGGSTIMTGGVCFRVPEMIHDRWVKERGLDMLGVKDLEPAFEAAERESRVETVPEDMRSRSTTKWVEGATKLRIPVKPMRRNTEGCVGHGRCNFGCPIGAKKSVDLAYLPAAVAAGARVYSDCLVEKITTRGGRAVGVRGRLLAGRDGRGSAARVGHFEVRARHVVLAAGTVHTPLLMMRSGFRSPHLGRHMTLHPGFRVVAKFADRLEGWKGALQSVYVDHFEHEGVTLTGLFVPPSVLAAGLPGTGTTFARRIQNLDRLAIFGGIVHDEGGGRVHNVPGREPLLTYRLGAKEKHEMVHGTRILAETFLAAGAEEVYLPIFGAPAMRTMEDVNGALHDQTPAKRMECVTFHPLGTCRIAKRPEDGVVDPWGRSFELENLTVACGSVFPTSIGVNSQLPILAMSTRMAWRLRDELRSG